MPQVCLDCAVPQTMGVSCAKKGGPDCALCGPKWYYSNSAGHDVHGQGLVIDKKTGDNIAVVYDSKNSEVIVQAVNSHERLLETNGELLAALESVRFWAVEHYGSLPWLDHVEAAIAKAKGDK